MTSTLSSEQDTLQDTLVPRMGFVMTGKMFPDCSGGKCGWSGSRLWRCVSWLSSSSPHCSHSHCPPDPQQGEPDRISSQFLLNLLMVMQDIRLISEGRRHQTYEINIAHWSPGNINLPHRLISWHIVRWPGLSFYLENKLEHFTLREASQVLVCWG